MAEAPRLPGSVNPSAIDRLAVDCSSSQQEMHECPQMLHIPGSQQAYHSSQPASSDV